MDLSGLHKIKNVPKYTPIWCINGLKWCKCVNYPKKQSNQVKNFVKSEQNFIQLIDFEQAWYRNHKHTRFKKYTHCTLGENFIFVFRITP